MFKSLLTVLLVISIVSLSACSTLTSQSQSQPQSQNNVSYQSKYDALIQYEDWSFDEFIMYLQFAQTK